MPNGHTPIIFAAMPFKDEFYPVFEAIEKAANILNMKVLRVDQEPFAGSIISYVRNSIEKSDYMVAVVSEENGNVITK